MKHLNSKQKQILDQPHEEHEPYGLFSRSLREKEVVWSWNKKETE